MSSAFFAPASLPAVPIDPNLTALMIHTLVPGESTLLQTQTNIDEAIMITTARVLIVKGPSRRTDPAHSGRYFPLDSIECSKTAGWFGISFVAIITADTAREHIGDRARCTFGVTFANRHLGNTVASYLHALLAHRAEQRRAALLNAPLRPITPTVGMAIGNGEEFYLQTRAIYYAQHAYTDYAGGYSGFSFRLMRGVSYRIGGTRGRGVRRKSLQVDDRGELMVGNRRVIFVGDRRNVEIALTRITSVKAFVDGVQIGVANKPLIQFSTPDQTPGQLIKRLLNIP